MTEASRARGAAVVLAAGTASRYRAEANGAATKLVALLNGKPLVRHVVESALASGARPAIVVTGHERALVEEALAGLSVQFVFNPDFATGLASSLKTGIAAVPADCAGAIVLLGDMPRVSAALIDRLVGEFAIRPDIDAVAPVHAGERGNPVVLGRSLFAAVAKLTGDQGARKLFGAARIADVEVADEAVALDVDTPAALGELAAKH